LLKLIFHDRTFKVEITAEVAVLAGDAEIEAIVIASMTDYTKFMLGLRHVSSALDMPRKYPKELSSDPSTYATKINMAVRDFLVRKHTLLQIPPQYKCPITLELMRQPVVLSDGNTYDLDAARIFLATIVSFPARGPLGTPLPNNQIIDNLSIRSSIYEFREVHKLPEPVMIAVSPLVQPALYPLAAVAVPQVPAFTPLYHLLREPRMDNGVPHRFVGNSFEALVCDTFLNVGLRKGGLLLMVNSMVDSLHLANHTIPHVDSQSKGGLIILCKRYAPQILAGNLLVDLWVRSTPWLDFLTSDGLTFLNHFLLDSYDSSHAPNRDASVRHKRSYFDQHYPIEVTLNSFQGNPQVMVIKKCWSIARVQAEYFNCLFRLPVDITYNAQLTLADHSLPVDHGSALTIHPRLPARLPSVEDLPAALRIQIKGLTGGLDFMHILPSNDLNMLLKRMCICRVFLRSCSCPLCCLTSCSTICA